LVLPSGWTPALVISPNVITSEIGILGRRALLTMASVRSNIWMLEHIDRRFPVELSAVESLDRRAARMGR
jgi:hypothetical protein